VLVLASRRNNLFKFAIAKTRSPTRETRVLPGLSRRFRFMSGAWDLGFGALVFAPMAQVTIETIKNGPYIVTGEVELIDADGNKYPVEKRMALCRCGASTEKPFCDGTHSKIGFQAAQKAVPESKE
jgi:CDGSH-type Zn-finger protein